MRVVSDLKGVHSVCRSMADGCIKQYHYAWRGGPRIKAMPGTDAYVEEYWRHVEERDGAPAKEAKLLAGSKRVASNVIIATRTIMIA